MAEAPLVGIEILGGLGNQMFQYAAALVLSRRLGAQMYCDTYRQVDDPNRPLGLGAFGATWREVHGPKRRGALRAMIRFLRTDPNNLFRDAIYFQEQEGHFNTAFQQIDSSCFLNGYFQSWRYFEGSEDVVRAAFDVEKLPVGKSGPIEAQIRAAAHPVAVHVRRGDFSDTPENAALRGPLGADYYREARRLIEETVPNPTWFLFSDEPAKAMAELSGWPDLIPVTGMTMYEDFRLMALCRHFVIANSTFSWWAAWLGKAPDKTVVAPKVWFGPAHRQKVVLGDLIPPGWLTL